MRGIFRVTCIAAVLAAFGASAWPAQAEPPSFNGLMNFPVIHGAGDSEEYTWKVILSPQQELKQIDDQRAAVIFEADGVTAMTITAEEARDATGAAVPTSLAVSAEDLITLTVHHHDGNPAVGGAPFQYPISPGPSFEAGYSTVIVTGPLDEAQLREEREKAERERAERQKTEREQAEAAERAAREPVQACLVPALRAASLQAAKRQLRQAGCGIGVVSKRLGATARAGRVVAQHPRAGSVLPAGTGVSVTLGKRQRP